jgi:hypothetical protein
MQEANESRKVRGSSTGSNRVAEKLTETAESGKNKELAKDCLTETSELNRKCAYTAARCHTKRIKTQQEVCGSSDHARLGMR